MNSQQVVGARVVEVEQYAVTSDFAAKHWDVRAIIVERPGGLRYRIELAARDGGEVNARTRRVS